MAKTIEKTVKKVRYISVIRDGEEMYTEPVSVEVDIRGCIPAAKLRLIFPRKSGHNEEMVLV